MPKWIYVARLHRCKQHLCEFRNNSIFKVIACETQLLPESTVSLLTLQRRWVGAGACRARLCYVYWSISKLCRSAQANLISTSSLTGIYYRSIIASVIIHWSRDQNMNDHNNILLQFTKKTACNAAGSSAAFCIAVLWFFMHTWSFTKAGS